MTYPPTTGYGQQAGHRPPAPAGNTAYSENHGYDPANAPPTDPGNPPFLVSATAVLMLVATVMQLISRGVFVVTQDPGVGIDPAASEAILVLTAIPAIVLTINWTIGVGILARGVSRGPQRARVITWIVFTAGCVGILWGAIDWINTEVSLIWMMSQLIMFLTHGAVLGLLALPVADNWFEASSKAIDPRIM